MLLRAGTLLGAPGAVASEAALLLDDYPNAAAAYSLRDLRTAYSGAIFRARRASDDAEKDFYSNGAGGFVDSGGVNITVWAAGTSAFVVTFYDQSGNGNNSTQSTAAQQVRIVSSGAVETYDGQTVAHQYNGQFTSYALGSAISGASPWCCVFVGGRGNAANPLTIFRTTTGNFWGFNFKNGSVEVNDRTDRAVHSPDTGFADTNIHIGISSSKADGTKALYADGTSLSLASQAVGANTLDFNSVITFNGNAVDNYFMEMIVWKSDFSASLAALSTAINDHYSVY